MHASVDARLLRVCVFVIVEFLMSFSMFRMM